MLRWIICPVATVNSVDFRGRAPKLHTIVDPMTGKPSQFSGAIGTASHCICLVRGISFVNILADSTCVDLFGQGYEDGDNFLAKTPAELGWNNSKQTQVKNRITARGISVTGLTAATPLWQWVERVGSFYVPGWTPTGTWVAP